MNQSFNESNNHKSAILIIDDEVHIVEALQEIANLQGVKSYTANNGREGVNIFNKHAKEIGLIFLDMMMPVMDGNTAFKEIRKIKPDQMICIMTGYSDPQNIEQLLNTGATSIIKKPFDLKEIVNFIQVNLAIQERENLFS